MATEQQRYLAKARESLASARADARAKRYNSAANRAYYSAFQAAVAALIWQGVKPEGLWQHRFVSSQFSGRLIRRRKVLSSEYSGILDELFRTRVTADYESSDVSQPKANGAASKAARFVDEVEQLMHKTTFREATAEYEAKTNSARRSVSAARKRILELEGLIRSRYPSAEFDVVKVGPSDYRVNVYAAEKGDVDLHGLLGSWTSDVLVDDDVWIVVVAHSLDRLPENN